MSKIRNSLGVLVLPVPDDVKTFDEYRELYGIDLSKVFPYKIENNDVYFDPYKESKLIYISENGGNQFAPRLVPVLSVAGRTIKDDDDNIIGRMVILPIMAYDSTTYEFITYAELTISVYVDPDTPNTVSIVEI